jgi:hypothetical protein
MYVYCTKTSQNLPGKTGPLSIKRNEHLGCLQVISHIRLLVFTTYVRIKNKAMD